MASVKAIKSYDGIYDFNYKLISDDLDKLQLHIEHIIEQSDFFTDTKNEEAEEVIERFADIQSLFVNTFGKNDSNGYFQIDIYEESISPNDKARNLLRGESEGMTKIIKKDTFSPAKLNTLDLLSEFFESGELELHQTEEIFDLSTDQSVNELKRELSSLPVADFVLEERQGK